MRKLNLILPKIFNIKIHHILIFCHKINYNVTIIIIIIIIIIINLLEYLKKFGKIKVGEG